ncbi:putative TPR-repeat-containing chaperone protein DNAJ [Trypanosoma conorhini]|uniref:Putative TPR-repeat-containing chaperone protein DNAJ n=1 Tax=Trypanosoma conorhini TaxID=83891 RepID=A0A3R7MUH1_9TRYP|nr:putative TPR-repeat-containing chaperone protein DNAJ [Trypanosoma conorhini]RNF20914.1 putative TPR-repeat-containing chaperone protein DNAJ [Trypanosoma conorhini]
MQRPVGRVGDVFQTHCASRAPRRLLHAATAVEGRAAGGGFGFVETIQLPEKIDWRGLFRLPPRGMRGVPPARVLWAARMMSPLLLLRGLRGLTRRTATTLAVASWADAAATVALVRRVNGRCHRRVGGRAAAVSLRRRYACPLPRSFLTAAEFDFGAMRVSQRCLAGDGPLQTRANHDGCVAVEEGVFSAALTEDGDESTALQLPRARWYARQAQRSLLDLESMRQLCQETRAQTNQRRVVMALGCIYASNDSGLPVTAVMRCLPISAGAATVAALLRSHRAVRRERLHEALATLLNDSHLTQEEAWVVLQAMTTVPDVNSVVEVRWVTEVVRRVVLGGGSSGAEPRVRTMTALRLGECVLPAEALALLCEESGLWYESAAYRSSAAGVPLEAAEHNRRRRNGCGFGNDMVALLRAVRNGESFAATPIAAIEALRKEMPPAVAAYTTHRVAAELTRREWETESGASAKQGDSSDSSSHGDSSDSRGASVTALQYLQTAAPPSRDAVGALASRLHFELRLGSASTALALLPSCRSNWDRTVRLMRHTHHAGVATALGALRGLMNLSPSGRYYVMVRLQPSPYCACGGHAGCNLLLEAKATAEGLGAPEAFEGMPAGLWRRLAEAAARQQPQVGQAFWSLPALYIPRVAAATPHLPSSLLSAWIRLLLRHGRYDSIDVVLQIAAERGVVPEMATLVEVLESVYERNKDAAQLQRLVRCVRSLFPDCAPAVFRAFVERTAGQMREGPLHSWSTGLHLLSTVSVLGLLHYPRSCLESIAACAPTPVVYAMLQILSEEGDAAAEGGGAAVPWSSSAPLELEALHRLLRSAQLAGLRPKVVVIAASPATRKTAWWASDTAAAGVPLATALYRKQAVGLWRHALQEVSWRNDVSADGVEVHHAIRLASFGSDSVATLLRGVVAAGGGAGGGEGKGGALAATGRARRRTRVEGAMFVATLACVAGALLARGRWESALRIIPPGVTDLPPLLRLARLKALQRSSDFDAHATMLLESEAQLRGTHRRSWRPRSCRHAPFILRHRRRRRGGGMPAGVRRLVVKMQMRDMFRWWEERG